MSATCPYCGKKCKRWDLQCEPPCPEFVTADAKRRARRDAEHAASQWIACSGRMPEPNHAVLTFGKCHHNALVAAWDPERDGWFYYAGEPTNVEDVCSCANITHWRPLPPPPEPA